MTCWAGSLSISSVAREYRRGRWKSKHGFTERLHGKKALDIRNESGIYEISEVIVASCEISYMKTCAIYATSGGSPTISHCNIHDTLAGVYVHGGSAIVIRYTTIYRVAIAVINSAMPNWYQKCNVQHTTIYDVSSSYSSGTVSWLGYEIWCGGSNGELSVYNSILCDIEKSGVLIKEIWSSFNAGYNCWYDIVNFCTFLNNLA